MESSFIFDTIKTDIVVKLLDDGPFSVHTLQSVRSLRHYTWTVYQVWLRQLIMKNVVKDKGGQLFLTDYQKLKEMTVGMTYKQKVAAIYTMLLFKNKGGIIPYSMIRKDVLLSIR